MQYRDILTVLLGNSENNNRPMGEPSVVYIK